MSVSSVIQSSEGYFNAAGVEVVDIVDYISNRPTTQLNDSFTIILTATLECESLVDSSA